MLRNDHLAAPTGRTMASWLSRTDHGHNWTSVAIATVALWVQRSRSRRVLATLDDDRLRDIGVSRADALLESAKPFWTPWARADS